MAAGPGAYDDLATLVRERSGGDMVLVIVLNGERGSGFSVQSIAQIGAPDIAGLLEQTARKIRQA